ncbi:hypothetical protein ACKWMY_17685 [Serratia sp. J2]|uniref:hypothetical protein n=1 Tax=Serratia sp. J2 TaxID=3386551 RepID=UPI003916EE55
MTEFTLRPHFQLGFTKFNDFFAMSFSGENSPKNVGSVLGTEASYFLSQLKKLTQLTDDEETRFLDYLKSKGF